MLVGRSIVRSTLSSYSRFAAAAAAATNRTSHLVPRHRLGDTRRCLSGASFPKTLPSVYTSPFAAGQGSIRFYSEDVAHMPDIKDKDIYNAFKDLMANSWDELSDDVLHDVKKALSKNTDDKAAQEILANVYRSAEAVEEFTGILTSLKMELDDSVGLSGENVKPLPDDLAKAIRIVFERYSAYLDSFGPEEAYLRKKVETELGSQMIHLKMRCAGLGSEWGKVTVLATSGLSGSYIEQRA